MPTGPRHTRYADYWVNGASERREEPCRCMIGDDHDDSQSLSPDEAEDIWLSSGMDEDYDFR